MDKWSHFFLIVTQFLLESAGLLLGMAKVDLEDAVGLLQFAELRLDSFSSLFLIVNARFQV